jgi:hypothetical protein
MGMCSPGLMTAKREGPYTSTYAIPLKGKVLGTLSECSAPRLWSMPVLRKSATLASGQGEGVL